MPETREILLLCASPHKGGTTEKLARLLQKGLASHASVSRILLAGKSLAGCLHCGACKKDGLCVLQDRDECEAIFAAMRKASLVIWLSPVYFYGLPAQAKALVDRSQRFYEAAMACHAKDAPVRPRALAFLVAGRTRGKHLFTGSHLALRYFFAALGLDFAGSLALRGLEEPADMGPEEERQIAHTAALIAGFYQGAIAGPVQSIACACPLFEDADPGSPGHTRANTSSSTVSGTVSGTVSCTVSGTSSSSTSIHTQISTSAAAHRG